MPQITPFDFGASLRQNALRDIAIDQAPAEHESRQRAVEQRDQELMNQRSRIALAARQLDMTEQQFVGESMKEAIKLANGDRATAAQLLGFYGMFDDESDVNDFLRMPNEVFENPDRLDEFFKGSTVITRDDQGQEFLTTNLINKRTGTAQTASTPLGGELISDLGETAREKSQRAVNEAGAKAEAKGAADRLSDTIERGIDAADSLPSIKRAISLIESGVKTGGFSQAQFEIARRLGVEDPNSGELSNLLSKAVLSQLRSTFGAAFTEREGARLERIEAGFGNNPTTNLRLLNNARTIAERAAQRGLSAAQEAEDRFAVTQIEDALKFELGDADDATLTPEEQSELEQLRQEQGPLQ